MKIYEPSQNFQVVVSTKKTLIGGDTSKFTVSYAPIDDLLNKTAVAGGVSEIVETVDSATAHTATVSGAVSYGARVIVVDSGHNVVAGDVIEYATGLYAYVTKVTATKLYLRTPVRAAIADGATLTQKGNTGVYETADISIASEGEYLVTIEAPEYGIVVEDRIRIYDTTTAPVADTDAPVYSEIAIAY